MYTLNMSLPALDCIIGMIAELMTVIPRLDRGIQRMLIRKIEAFLTLFCALCALDRPVKPGDDIEYKHQKIKKGNTEQIVWVNY
ncbi:MAG: hypothetical protein HQK83_20715 [Fibrobacteria bacterium]|nr:hypothetical protein [Fibrobacteria bacterium]